MTSTFRSAAGAVSSEVAPGGTGRLLYRSPALVVGAAIGGAPVMDAIRCRQRCVTLETPVRKDGPTGATDKGID
jgi:hypothetical protein